MADWRKENTGVTTEESPTPCLDREPLLIRLLDGDLSEVEEHEVRSHAAACGDCSETLRQWSGLGSRLMETVEARVASLDFASFWDGVEGRLAPVVAPVPWWVALRERWQERLAISPALWPSVAMMAVAALIAVYAVVTGIAPAGPSQPRLVAVADPPAFLDSIESSYDSLAILDDVDNDTLILWVAGGDGPVFGDEP